MLRDALGHVALPDIDDARRVPSVPDHVNAFFGYGRQIDSLEPTPDVAGALTPYKLRHVYPPALQLK
jgi:hypothetical protein